MARICHCSACVTTKPLEMRRRQRAFLVERCSLADQHNKLRSPSQVIQHTGCVAHSIPLELHLGPRAEVCVCRPPKQVVLQNAMVGTEVPFLSSCACNGKQVLTGAGGATSTPSPPSSLLSFHRHRRAVPHPLSPSTSRSYMRKDSFGGDNAVLCLGSRVAPLCACTHWHQCRALTPAN
jgi:hypothetical protein